MKFLKRKVDEFMCICKERINCFGYIDLNKDDIIYGKTIKTRNDINSNDIMICDCNDETDFKLFRAFYKENEIYLISQNNDVKDVDCIKYDETNKDFNIIGKVTGFYCSYNI